MPAMGLNSSEWYLPLRAQSGLAGGDTGGWVRPGLSLSLTSSHQLRDENPDLESSMTDAPHQELQF